MQPRLQGIRARLGQEAFQVGQIATQCGVERHDDFAQGGIASEGRAQCIHVDLGPGTRPLEGEFDDHAVAGIGAMFGMHRATDATHGGRREGDKCGVDRGIVLCIRHSEVNDLDARVVAHDVHMQCDARAALREGVIEQPDQHLAEHTQGPRQRRSECRVHLESEDHATRLRFADIAMFEVRKKLVEVAACLHARALANATPCGDPPCDALMQWHRRARCAQLFAPPTAAETNPAVTGQAR